MEKTAAAQPTGVVTKRKERCNMPISYGQKGVKQEMHKYKEGKLHSGSPKGPVVKNKKQALAISLNAAGVGRNARKAMT